MKKKTITCLLLFVFSACIVTAQGLRVEAGTNIKVETATTLDISAGDLILVSDATGDASLLDYGSVTYTGGGEARVQRYLTNDHWHLVTSPVSAATAAVFTGDYLQYFTESNSAWVDVTSSAYGLNIMQGFGLWSVGTGASTKVFEGITNTGNQSKAFTKSGDGWNLVGNPYPCVLDWDEVVIPTELSGAIWLFDPTVGESGDYKYYILGGGGANTTSQYIPSGQGFFVSATAPGTLALTNAARVHNPQAFFKSSGANEMLLIQATGNDVTTQTAIRFNTDATQQIDRLFDVYKVISGSTDVPVVYTQCGNEKMAINTLPSVIGNEIVPLYFEAGMDGTYTFNASEIESLDPILPVILEDIAQNYFQDLRLNPEYSFAYNTGAVKNFNVHFALITGIETTDPLNINCYLNQDVLHVNFPNNETAGSLDATISVYNLLGQQLLSVQTSKLNNEIPLRGSPSIYLVHVTTSRGTFATKVVNR